MTHKPLTDITLAMNNYNTNNNYNFTLLDAIIINHLTSYPYTTDSDLAARSICSERTVKRAINKLCTFGLLEKYFDPDHTKHVQINFNAYNNFLKDNQKEVI